MSRTLPTGLDTALAQLEVAPVFLVYLDWPTGPVRCWNGYHSLVWGGFTWLGTGDLGGISDITETSDLSANGTVLTLTGVPSVNVAQALANNSQGRSAQVRFGVINGSGFSLDPYLVFDGLIDNCSIVDDGINATIQINLEKEMFDDRSQYSRYTDQDQKFRFPTDRGLEYTAGLALKQFTWGKATVNPNSDAGGGGDTEGRSFAD
jgi:hypothetical protein